MPVFLLCLAVLASCAAKGGPNVEPLAVQFKHDSGPRRSSKRLVVVTLNTHSFQEGPNSIEKLRAIGRGLAALPADIVALNEVMSGRFPSFGGQHHDAVEIIREALETASCQPWHVVVSAFAHWDTGEQMANAVLTHFPVTESGERVLTTTDFWPGPSEQRKVVYIRAEPPQIGPVALFATQAWGWDSVDTLTQIDEIKSLVAAKTRGDEANVFVVGDLNIEPSSLGYDRWIGEPLPLVDTFAVANPEQRDNSTTIGEQHRIDYIFATRTKARYQSFLAFDGSTRNEKTTPIVSDHKAVVTIFEAGH